MDRREVAADDAKRLPGSGARRRARLPEPEEGAFPGRVPALAVVGSWGGVADESALTLPGLLLLARHLEVEPAADGVAGVRSERKVARA